jgi:hypothetical protein
MHALKFLTIATLAAASSVAAAQERDQFNDDRDYSYDDRGYHEYDSRDQRYDREADRRDRYSRWDRSRNYDHRWLPLVRGTSADDGRQNILFRGNGGRLDNLRLQADRGAPVIKRVVVEYLNGAREVVRVNTQLRPGQGQLIRVDQNQPVREIIVITDGRYRGRYSVYGDTNT